MRNGLLVTSVALVAAVALGACGSASKSASTTTSTTTTTTSTPATTQNLVVTPSVRASLLAAGAASHQLPVSDYTGLAAGTTYYAYDPTTYTYYAAAGIDASPNSLAAQVGDQDDGGYLLFTETNGATSWKVYNDGLGGAEGSVCPITIPTAVLDVWSWKANSCYPPPN